MHGLQELMHHKKDKEEHAQFSVELSVKQLNQITTVSFLPCLRLVNLLPCSAEFNVYSDEGGKHLILSMLLDAGKHMDLLTGSDQSARYLKIDSVKGYKGTKRTAKIQAGDGAEHGHKCEDYLKLLDDQDRRLKIALDYCRDESGIRTVHAYAKTWFCNKSGIDLVIGDTSSLHRTHVSAQSAVIAHPIPITSSVWPSQEEAPIMFTYEDGQSGMISKITALLATNTRGHQGKWSDPFSVDAVGHIAYLRLKDAKIEKQGKLDKLKDKAHISHPETAPIIRRTYDIGLSFTLASEPFQRTKVSLLFDVLPVLLDACAANCNSHAWCCGARMGWQVVTLFPRCLLVNRTANPIEWKQADQSAPTDPQIDSGQWNAVNFVGKPDADRLLNIRFTAGGIGGQWSGAIRADCIGEDVFCTIQYPAAGGKWSRGHFVVTIQLKGPTYLIFVKEMSEENPSYRIENRSSLGFHYFQLSTPSDSTYISAGTGGGASTHVFTWSAPLDEHIVQIIFQASKTKSEIPIDDIALKPQRIIVQSVREGAGEKVPSQHVLVSVVADGPTRVLRVTDIASRVDRNAAVAASDQTPVQARLQRRVSFRADEVSPTAAAAAAAATAMEDSLLHTHASKPSKHAADTTEPAPAVAVTNFVLKLKGVGISVVSKDPQELLYVFLRDVFFETLTSHLFSTIEFKLGHLQIDSQLGVGDPVILSPIQLNETLLHLAVTQAYDMKNVSHLEYASILLRPMELRALKAREMVLALVILETTESLNRLAQKEARGSTASQVGLYQDPYIMVISESLKSKSKTLSLSRLYAGYIHIHPIRFVISYGAGDASEEKTVKLVETHRNARKALKRARHTPAQRSGLQIALLPLQAVRGGVEQLLTSIEKAEINLNGFTLSNMLETTDDLTAKVVSHFVKQAVSCIYSVIGSFELLGSPVSLLTSVAGGFKDLVYEPTQALVYSPRDLKAQEFKLALRKGGGNFADKTVGATFEASAKITGVLGRGLGNLAGDSKYSADRFISQYLKHSARRRSFATTLEDDRGATSGLARGVIGFGKGVFDGVTGLVTKPVEGAMKGGIAGFGKGIAQGVIGIGLKPVAGLLDLATQTAGGVAESIHHATGSGGKAVAYHARQIRPMRIIDEHGAVHAYDRKKAEGLAFLKTVSDGKYAPGFRSWAEVFFGEEPSVTFMYVLKDSLITVDPAARFRRLKLDLRCIDRAALSPSILKTDRMRLPLKDASELLSRTALSRILIGNEKQKVFTMLKVSTA